MVVPSRIISSAGPNRLLLLCLNMLNRFNAGLIALSIITGLIFYQSSCKKAPQWASSKFAGNFSGNETCLLSGAQRASLKIVAINDTQVNITNLYGITKSLIGNISHDSCTLPPQIADTLVMQGLLILSSDTLNLSIIASSFGRENSCTAVLIKH